MTQMDHMPPQGPEQDPWTSYIERENGAVRPEQPADADAASEPAVPVHPTHADLKVPKVETETTTSGPIQPSRLIMEVPKQPDEQRRFSRLPHLGRSAVAAPAEQTDTPHVSRRKLLIGGLVVGLVVLAGAGTAAGVEFADSGKKTTANGAPPVTREGSPSPSESYTPPAVAYPNTLGSVLPVKAGNIAYPFYQGNLGYVGPNGRLQWGNKDWYLPYIYLTDVDGITTSKDGYVYTLDTEKVKAPQTDPQSTNVFALNPIFRAINTAMTLPPGGEADQALLQVFSPSALAAVREQQVAFERLYSDPSYQNKQPYSNEFIIFDTDQPSAGIKPVSVKYTQGDAEGTITVTDGTLYGRGLQQGQLSGTGPFEDITRAVIPDQSYFLDDFSVTIAPTNPNDPFDGRQLITKVNFTIKPRL